MGRDKPEIARMKASNCEFWDQNRKTLFSFPVDLEPKIEQYIAYPN